MATLIARQIHADPDQTVIVVGSVDVNRETSEHRHWLMAWSRPVAIVAQDASGARALDMIGEPLDLEELLRESGELRDLLDRP